MSPPAGSRRNSWLWSPGHSWECWAEGPGGQPSITGQRVWQPAHTGLWVWLAWLQAQTFQTAGGEELPCSGSSPDSRIWRSKGTLPASAFHSTCFPGSCLQSRPCSGLAECRVGLATCLRVQCGEWLLWSSIGPGSSTHSSGGPRGSSCPGPPPPQQAIFQDRISGCTWKH